MRNYFPLIWINGEIIHSEKKPLALNFETFQELRFQELALTQGTRVLFAEETIARITGFLKIYHLNSMLFSNSSEKIFSNEIRRLLIRNNFYKTGSVRFFIITDLQREKQLEYLLLEPLPTLLDENNLIHNISVMDKFPKPEGFLLNLPTLNIEYRKIIEAQCVSENKTDGILLNHNQNIVESYLGNIFLVKGNLLQTPSPQSGCVIYPLRKMIIESITEMGLIPEENDHLTIEDLFNADELFVAGNEGIYSVRGFEYKRYFDTTKRILVKRIAEKIVNLD
jgi:branched-subunit amino acid aminotransferase/4-amino-4-deoxychorismate lyase